MVWRDGSGGQLTQQSSATHHPHTAYPCLATSCLPGLQGNARRRPSAMLSVPLRCHCSEVGWRARRAAAAARFRTPGSCSCVVVVGLATALGVGRVTQQWRRGPRALGRGGTVGGLESDAAACREQVLLSATKPLMLYSGRSPLLVLGDRPLRTCSGSILALHHCRLCVLFGQADVPVLPTIDCDLLDVTDRWYNHLLGLNRILLLTLFHLCLGDSHAARLGIWRACG